MSHAMGEVWTLNGELVGYYEYNGTCDLVMTRIQINQQEVLRNWRTNFNIASCNDKQHQKTRVIIYSAYGGGFHWDGEACLICNCITKGLEPHEAEDGHPFRD